MDVRLPDGTVIQNVPEGTTKDQLRAKLSASGHDIHKMGLGPTADDIPGGGVSGSRNVGKPDEGPQDNMLGKAFGAVVETPLAIGSGMIGGAAGAIAGVGKAALKKLTTGQGSSDKEVNDTTASVANALTYAPRTQTGNALVRGAGEAINDSGLAGIPIPELNLLARTSAPVVKMAAGRTAGAVDAAANGVGNKLAQVARAATPRVDPQVAALAEKAQSYDIPLRPDMLTTNKFARIIGESLEKVPLSGSTAEARQTGFNKAVIGTIGGDASATRLTPDVFDAAMKRSGQKIGDIAQRTPVSIDPELSGALKSHLENAAKYETSDVQRVIGSYIDELQAKAGAEGVIPGEAFRKLNSKIGKQMRSTGNGDLKHALGELQDDLQNALERHASETDLPDLMAARKQYAIGKTLEPLVAKSPTGDISPAALMGRVTATGDGKARMARGNGGEIGDIARIGQQFLKEPNSSNTAERGLTYGLLGGGLATHPVAAASAYTAANLYNRLGPKAVNALLPTKP